MDVDPLWISEGDVVALVDLRTAIDAVEEAFRAESAGSTANMRKTHLVWGGGHSLHAIGAVDESRQLVATKTWAHTDGGATPLLILWGTDGSLRAVIEAFALGQLRTAAVSGVATRYLAPTDASVLGLIGSGKQALPQAAAVAAVRPIRYVRVFSPNADNRRACVEKLGNVLLDCSIEAVDTVEAAVADAHVVTTATRARSPFLHAGMLGEDVHINAVGAVTPERRELANDVVTGARRVVTDDVDTARHLAPELVSANDVARLCDVVAAGTVAREPGVSVFKAMGVGIGDLALGAEILALATPLGVGRTMTAPRRVTPRLARSAT